MRADTDCFADSMSEAFVTSRLSVLIPIAERSLSTSLLRAVAMTWSPGDVFRYQLLLFLSCPAASTVKLYWRIGVPFEWNSLANACPMPPGEHLQVVSTVSCGTELSACSNIPCNQHSSLGYCSSHDVLSL